MLGEASSTHVNGGIGFDGDLAPWPWWIGSVGEAVGLVSYERNADRIQGIFYVSRGHWSLPASHANPLVNAGPYPSEPGQVPMGHYHGSPCR